MHSLTFSFFPAPSLRMPARKANDFGFRARTPVRKNGVGEPDGAQVCVRLPAKPMISVSGREPRAMEFRKCGPAAGPKEMGKVKNKKIHAAAG